MQLYLRLRLHRCTRHPFASIRPRYQWYIRNHSLTHANRLDTCLTCRFAHNASAINAAAALDGSVIGTRCLPDNLWHAVCVADCRFFCQSANHTHASHWKRGVWWWWVGGWVGESRCRAGPVLYPHSRWSLLPGLSTSYGQLTMCFAMIASLSPLSTCLFVCSIVSAAAVTNGFDGATTLNFARLVAGRTVIVTRLEASVGVSPQLWW